MGKTGENKNPLNFSQQQPSTHRSFPSSSCSHLPLFSSPRCFLLKITPRRGALLGGSPPERRPCSSHAGNNLSLLQKNQKLLEGSTPHTSSSSQAFSQAAATPCASTCRLLAPVQPPDERQRKRYETKELEERGCWFMHFVPDSNLQLPFSIRGFTLLAARRSCITV